MVNRASFEGTDIPGRDKWRLPAIVHVEFRPRFISLWEPCAAPTY